MQQEDGGALCGCIEQNKRLATWDGFTMVVSTLRYSTAVQCTAYLYSNHVST